MLISKTASFEFINLKHACASICPNNSSVFFTEVLQKILSSKETQDIKEVRNCVNLFKLFIVIVMTLIIISYNLIQHIMEFINSSFICGIHSLFYKF